MRFRTFPLVAIWLLTWTFAASAQSQLPILEDIEAEPFRERCRPLCRVMALWMTAEDSQKLANLTQPKAPPADAFSETLQKFLDRYCLIGVTINPESRVKAARGPLEAVLVQGQETLVLIKMQNDAGVTEGLTVSGDQIRTAKENGKGRWLEASVVREKPLKDKLSGQRLEYLVLRLKAHETGKREATLKFDVGQGTQDLGFRGEVPVLFTVRAAKQSKSPPVQTGGLGDRPKSQ